MREVPEKGLIACQISFYPLGETDYLPHIDAVLALIQESGLAHTVGEMSTLITGPAGAVFALLQHVTEQARCQFSMTAAISNTCGLSP